MRAVGIHCFAGGFTQGVRRVAEVECQLEVSDFGRRTVESLGVPVHVDPEGRWIGAVERGIDLLYGNPRCTAFSCLSGGCSSRRRGPDAEPTTDIRQLCHYGRRHRATVVAWESVQQALSVGLPLVRDEERRFLDAGYDVTHVLMTTADFGVPQNRRRYFFVASRVELRLVAPLPVPRSLTSDVLEPMVDRTVREVRNLARLECEDPDVSPALNPDERLVEPLLREGESLNHLCRFRWEELEQVSRRYADICLFRHSNLPFGLHGLKRLRWDAVCPTLHSGAKSFLHPRRPRKLSIAELAALMGWHVTPLGTRPLEQIVKGIVPAVGEWLARCVESSLGGPGATKEVRQWRL